MWHYNILPVNFLYVIHIEIEYFTIASPRNNHKTSKVHLLYFCVWIDENELIYNLVNLLPQLLGTTIPL